jgi:phosphoribosylformylglycinamidine synthase PurS subunit
MTQSRPEMKIEVRVYPKPSVLDPQGKAIAGALQRLGHAVTDVRAGKIFFVDVDSTDRTSVEDETHRPLRMKPTVR